jgi:hypothetical protein
MDSKKELIDLINSIKTATGITQKDISVAAGYTEKYLSEVISKDAVTRKVINNVRRTFPVGTEKTTIKAVKSPFPDDGLMEERAMIRVLAREVAELRVLIDKKGNADDITMEYAKRAKAVLDAMKAF